GDDERPDMAALAVTDPGAANVPAAYLHGSAQVHVQALIRVARRGELHDVGVRIRRGDGLPIRRSREEPGAPYRAQIRQRALLVDLAEEISAVRIGEEVLLVGR